MLNVELELCKNVAMKVVWEKVINTIDLVVSPRPVWKCKMCSMYGKRLSCPPFVPSWSETKEWVRSYREALLYKFSIDMGRFEDEKRSVIKFLLERERLFFKDYPFAYALFPGSCNLCSSCPVEEGRDCLKPQSVRPSVDALGIEIISVADIDFSESVLYALLFLG